MSLVIGIHAPFGSHVHDPSVAVVKDGKLLFALEEERLNRFKTSPGLFPEYAFKEALKFCSINIHSIDRIAFDGISAKALPSKIKRYISSMYGHSPALEPVLHPIAHGSSSFFSSSFDEALVFSIDGEGDGISVLVYLDSRLGKRKLVYKSKYPASLGTFYTCFTNYLGFKSVEGEFKVMGMAAYGDPAKYSLGRFLSFDHLRGELVCDPRLRDVSNHTSVFEPHVNYDYVSNLIDVPQVNSSNPERLQCHYDLAASVQSTFEDAYLGMIDYFVNLTGVTNICLSGGCALNCLANMKLICDRPYSVFIQPASSDRGLSIGSAFEVSKSLGDTPISLNDVYLGPSYCDESIHKAIALSGLPFMEIPNISRYAAEKISNGSVLGWFQGRSEFGPRALGGRSILASASIPGNRDKLNAKIKFREKFRPFAPVILESDMKLVSSYSYHSPYMTSTFPLSPNATQLIPEVYHSDGTARFQTVNSKSSPLYDLLVSYKAITGIGCVINTSFNLAGEPIVETPTDALRTFVSSGIDELCIGEYAVFKA